MKYASEFAKQRPDELPVPTRPHRRRDCDVCNWHRPQLP